ncbi:MAG: hypothetical protein IID40_01430, partial [Planctomycetes bacterium]|nr:hypothetical protein [Planctomycetota bacterium]
METIALDFTRLLTPAADGEVLVEPAPASMRALLDATAALIDRWDVSLADRDLRSVRREVRRRVADVEDERPVVVIGHQPEFIHPGVWAKHVVAARLAEAADGVAVNLIVDTDAPQKTFLHVPMLGGERLGAGAVRFANIPAGVPYECIPRYDAAAVDRLKRALADALGPRYDRSMLGVYFEAFAGHAEPGDFVDQAVAGHRAIERRYGVTLIERRVSRVWFCPLLVEMLARAERFFDCYNAALSDYRRAFGIRGTHRPVPDLLRRESRFELPVWVQQADDPRSRLFVERRRGALHLFADRRSIGVIDSEALKSWDSARTA